jgi:hypothetical protein
MFYPAPRSRTIGVVKAVVGDVSNREGVRRKACIPRIGILYLPNQALKRDRAARRSFRTLRSLEASHFLASIPKAFQSHGEGSQRFKVVHWVGAAVCVRKENCRPLHIAIEELRLPYQFRVVDVLCMTSVSKQETRKGHPLRVSNELSNLFLGRCQKQHGLRIQDAYVAQDTNMVDPHDRSEDVYPTARG